MSTFFGPGADPARTDFIIVGRDNGYGLSQDARIITDAIVRHGLTVGVGTPSSRALLDRIFSRTRARTVIHLERVFPQWLSAGRTNWLLPNQERFPNRHSVRLKHIELVLAKSQHSAPIFSRLGSCTQYLGFSSLDRLRTDVERNWNTFLHIAGGSTLKGTEDLIVLWRRHPEWPELIIVHKATKTPLQVPPNIRLLTGYLDDDHLVRLQNQCGMHLCPSRSEGWGHYIVEGMSCGAVVLTTDAAPMNEHVTPETGLLVRWASKMSRNLGEAYFVDRDALESAIAGMVALPTAEKQSLGARARARYESRRAAFDESIAALLKRGCR